MIACPYGCFAAADSGGTVPFVKMPKFQYAISGPAMDYTVIECIDASGWITVAQQTNFPNVMTSGTHCSDDDRSRIDVLNRLCRRTTAATPTPRTRFVRIWVRCAGGR